MASIRKLGNNWRAEVNKTFNGVTHRPTAVFPTKAEAQAWSAEKEKQLTMYFSEISRTKKNFGIYGKSILCHEDALKKSIPSMAISAIYLLIDEMTVVYVGKSKNALSRIAGHFEKGRKFTRYTIIPCAADEMDKLEASYISAYDPIHNRTPARSTKTAPNNRKA